jgi:hypothetical protein
MIRLHMMDSGKSSLRKQLDAESRTFLLKRSLELKDAIAARTPIDTGLARRSWRVSQNSGLSCTIQNEVPYIDELNQGSSRQAPAHFVEAVALQYGKPQGLLVQTIPP